MKVVKSFIRNEKGTITVYLVIIFITTIAFTGMFVDLARIKCAQNHLRGISNASARSVLADYDTTLRNQFGLFAVASPGDNTNFHKYLRSNLQSPANYFNLMDYRLESSEMELKHPLADTEVLKRQILEDMKYTGPIELTRGLLDKLKPMGGLLSIFSSQNNNKKTISVIDNHLNSISKANSNIKDNKEKLRKQKQQLKDTSDKNNLTEIKKAIQADLDLSRNARKEIEAALGQWEGDFSTNASTFYDSVDLLVSNNINSVNKETLAAIESHVSQISKEIELSGAALEAVTTNGPELDEDQFSKLNIDSADRSSRTNDDATLVVNPPSSLLDELRIYKKKFLNRFPGDVFPVLNVGFDAKISATGKVSKDQIDFLQKVSDLVNLGQTVVNMRNEIFINEYALSRFSCLSDGSFPMGGAAGQSGEIEYILYGQGSKLKAVTELYNTRFALDTLAYFLFSQPPAPADLLVRTAYSLVMGSLQAALDTFKLLTDSANQVAVAEMMPNNPLDKLNLQFTYKDHLRLFMLLHNDEDGKLGRISQLIQEKTGLDNGNAYTGMTGSVESSIRLWFLPLAGFGNLKNGPFGTQIINGRCYIKKDVEYSY